MRQPSGHGHLWDQPFERGRVVSVCQFFFFVCNQNFAVFYYRVDFKLVQPSQFYSDSNKVKFFELMDVQALRKFSSSGGAPLGGATR